MRETLRCALKEGYRHIDTAYLYLNEDAIGDELEEWINSGKIKREDIFITSKVYKVAYIQHFFLFRYKSIDFLILSSKITQII